MKTKTSVKILTPYTRSTHPVSRLKNSCWGNDPLYQKFWANLTPLLQKRRFSIDFCS